MQPLMNLLHLKFFRDAVLYNSLSEAAKVNFVTQSAVSQGIDKLEKILGTQLIQGHAKQKFQLTNDGKIVFEQIRHVFKSIQNIHDGINQNREAVTGALRFVTTKSLGMSFIAPSYKLIKEHFPQLEMSLKLGGLNYIRNAIKEGDVEFGIVVYDQNFSQFVKHPLRKGKFHLYQNINHSKNYVEEGILVNEYKGPYVNELREFLDAHSNLRIRAELSGWEIVARFTELNLGIGFFPDYIMANDRYSNIRIYPLELPPYEYEICAIYNRGEALSRAAQAFIEKFTLELPK